jgi:hypothetical protein
MRALLAARFERIVRDRKAYQRARERALIRLRKGLICDGCLLPRETSFMSNERLQFAH